MNEKLNAGGCTPIGCVPSQPKQQEGFFDSFINDFYQKNNEFDNLLIQFENLLYKLSNQNARAILNCDNSIKGCDEANDIVSNLNRLGNSYANKIDYLREILGNFREYI